MNKVSLIELMFCISDVLDLISDEVKDHHKRVACAAYYLAEAMQIDENNKRDIVLAAALHDIGGLSLNDRLSTIFGFEDSTLHAEKGYKLLSVFEPFENVANIVRYHHTIWNYGKLVDIKKNALLNFPEGSQIVLMADRISVMLNQGIHVLNQASGIREIISEQENKIYNPHLVAAFMKISQKDSFWLDIISQTLNDLFAAKLKMNDIYFTDSNLTGIMELISSIIDFRSFFTATHSRGVSAVAEALAKLVKFSESDSQTMKMAGLVHDIGKLAVPVEILEKNGSLNEYERDIIRTHAYYTDRVLSHVSGFNTIREWASSHHESLNGQGYPFGLCSDELSLGARIMKVADIYAALMEDRPYRKGMDIEKALAILNSMSANAELDGGIVSILSENSKYISELLHSEVQTAGLMYKKFLEDLEN